jgi:hypothetical protein
MLPAALKNLSDKDEKELYFIPLTDEAGPNTKNYAKEDNIENAINYLKGDSSATKPLIIDNFDSYDLSTILDSDNNALTGYSGDLTLNSNDILIFHYSGHGEGYTGSLILRNALDSSSTDILTLDTLYSLFDNLSCKTLLLIDSCYSGTAIPISSTTISTNDPRVNVNWFYQYFSFLFEDNSTQNLIEENSKVFIISATTSDKKSTENLNTKKKNGSFTLALLDSLGWDIEEDDTNSLGSSTNIVPAITNGVVSIDGIYEYISESPHETYNYDARIIGGRYDLTLFSL